MASLLVNDSALKTTSSALDALALKQQVISQNLANVDTPGYKAQTVSFESSLQAAIEQEANNFKMDTTNERHLASQNVSSATVQQLDRTGGSTRADGNNVDIDTELIDMNEVYLKYQTLTQAASKKLLLLKTIVQSR